MTEMLQLRRLAPLLAAILACAPAAPAASPPRDLGRETLPEHDGWAAATTGTTGGSRADDAHIRTVADRAQLVAALGPAADTSPKIVHVKGTIDGNVDEAGVPLGCDAYATAGYALEAYLKAYDPATWGRAKRPAGAMEDARAASQKRQAARTQIRVGANTTIVGLDGARLVGVDLVVEQVDNVIIRNLTFVDAYDCFPQWDPTDGSQGNWNSQYDNISINGATHVWIDHCAFTDGDRADARQPSYFARPYQVHDGQVDITKAADLVTISWNLFADHDKTMLIGSSDTAAADSGKLNVTVHHNLFREVGQRAPRVRFGRVHVYDNLYVLGTQGYSYTWGVGVDARLYVEDNVVRSVPATSADRFIRAFGGRSIHLRGTLVDDGAGARPVDVLVRFNANADAKLDGEVGWTPTLVGRRDRVEDVAAVVEAEAGPIRSATGR